MWGWVKKNWSVEMTKEAEKSLRLDFKTGKVTSDDIKVIKRWIADVENKVWNSLSISLTGEITS